MPVFNGKKYISESIKSVLSQSYIDWELIIIDDGSTDDVHTVISDFLKDNRIKYLRQENSGVVRARNRGVNNARGEYIAFLDADDIWMPVKLEQQMKVFANTKEDIFICSNFQYINKDGAVVGEFFSQKTTPHQGWVGKYLLADNFILTSSVLMPKQVFSNSGGFNEQLSLKIGEDHELWLRVSSHVKLVCSENSLVYYRVHEDQNTKSRFKNYVNTIRLYSYLFLNSGQYKNINKVEIVVGFLRRFKRVLLKY
jgi:glycosyltransferase involved in cell wall biosynthesis